MNFPRPIVFFDLEATGLDIAKDRIIEFAAIKHIKGETTTMCHLFNPGIPIPPESTEIHGIKDEDVNNQPKFHHLATDLHEFMQGCIIAGFNCRNFDVPMLWEEFWRADIEWKVDPMDIIDAGNIFKLKHPRNLEAAVKTYCKREHKDAHSALADVEATADVFRGQLNTHDDLFDMSSDQLAEYCMMEERRADLCGTIVYNEAGIAVFNTKRNKGVPVVNDLGYARWMLSNDFPESTKRAIEKIIQ
jgi:DNA polymerase-3 subunit epsilon